MKKASINQYLSRSHNENLLDLRNIYTLRLKELGLSDNQACNLLSIDKNSLNPLLDGTAKHPNLLNVIKIADFLDLTIDEIMPSLLAKLPSQAIGKLDRVSKLSFLTRHFDLDKLHKAKFLETKSDSEYITKRILHFFGFNSIHEYEEYDGQLNAVVFSKTKSRFSDRVRSFAIKSAYRIFELINNPNVYDREELKNLIPKIKPYSQDVEHGLYTVCRSLYNVGVTVIFQKHLATSQYRGATFIYNGKPCIVLTDLNKKYPTIWFALLHELYHVLFDLETIEKHGFHLTGEPELIHINENDADEFAQDFFFDEASYRYIKPHIHNKFVVKNFAKKNQIDPSFIYRGFQYFAEKVDDQNYWAAFHDKFPPIDLAILKLKPVNWQEKQSIPEIAKTIREVFNLK